MQVKIYKYNKWYCSKKLRNVVDVKISEIRDEKDIVKIYNIFKEVIVGNSVLMDFSNSHGFDDDENISSNIDSIKKDISNNNGNFDFIYVISMSHLYGIVQIDKEKLDEDIFIKLCNAFEGITFYSSNNEFDYVNLKQLLESKKKVLTHEYLIFNNLADSTFTFFNDRLEVHIRINSEKLNVDEILNEINLIIKV